jgi:6-pyruvoyltetrahydropterin/6-carboxytetrahydropterin synthase
MLTRVYALRYHDFSAGHRVFGHENKCGLLHGHNYRIHFWCEAPQLDQVGRVIDFSVIKSRLCDWLELNWDHKMLLWNKDADAERIAQASPGSVHLLPFNPTAENMGLYLLNEIGPRVLDGTGVRLVRVQVDETRKCGVVVECSQ